MRYPCLRRRGHWVFLSLLQGNLGLGFEVDAWRNAKLLLKIGEFAGPAGLVFVIIIILPVVVELGHADHGGRLLQAVEHEAGRLGFKLSFGNGFQNLGERDLDGAKVVQGGKVQAIGLAAAKCLSSGQAASAEIEMVVAIIAPAQCG